MTVIYLLTEHKDAEGRTQYQNQMLMGWPVYFSTKDLIEQKANSLKEINMKWENIILTTRTLNE